MRTEQSNVTVQLTSQILYLAVYLCSVIVQVYNRKYKRRSKEHKLHKSLPHAISAVDEVFEQTVAFFSFGDLGRKNKKQFAVTLSLSPVGEDLRCTIGEILKLNTKKEFK